MNHVRILWYLAVAWCLLCVTGAATSIGEYAAGWTRELHKRLADELAALAGRSHRR